MCGHRRLALPSPTPPYPERSRFPFSVGALGSFQSEPRREADAHLFAGSAAGEGPAWGLGSVKAAGGELVSKSLAPGTASARSAQDAFVRHCLREHLPP